MLWVENTNNFPDVPLARKEYILIEAHRVILSSVWTTPSLCLPLLQSSCQSGIKVVKLPSTSPPIVASSTSPSIFALVSQAPSSPIFLPQLLLPASVTVAPARRSGTASVQPVTRLHRLVKHLSLLNQWRLPHKLGGVIIRLFIQKLEFCFTNWHSDFLAYLWHSLKISAF